MYYYMPRSVKDEALILWPLDVKSWLFGKDPDAGKDWRQEEKGTIEDKTVGWHHQHNGDEFEKTLGDDRQVSLACCSPWGHKELDMTGQLNNKRYKDKEFISNSEEDKFLTCLWWLSFLTCIPCPMWKHVWLSEYRYISYPNSIFEPS